MTTPSLAQAPNTAKPTTRSRRRIIPIAGDVSTGTSVEAAATTAPTVSPATDTTHPEDRRRKGEKPWHPFASAFPMMGADELAALVEDIKQNGLRDPILLDADGRILDGRNRERACAKAHRKPKYLTFRPERPERADSEALTLIISRNLHRRHLDTSQRAMVAARIATLKDGQRADKLRKSAEVAPVTQPAAATLLNVSTRSVTNAKQVLDRGTPELVAAVEAGTVPVSAAVVVSQLPHEEQRALVADPGTLTHQVATARAAKKTRAPKSIDANRIVAVMAMDAVNLTADVNLIDFNGLDHGQLDEWLVDLRNGHRALGEFIAQLEKLRRASVARETPAS
jgi:ParB-like chromosome segregation protein Spo0J